MLKRYNHAQAGFTIIEVLIVLAIAGVILAAIFIGVSQLQRVSRDNNRKEVLVRVKNELDTYASNNYSRYPFAGVSNIWVSCSDANPTVNSCNYWWARYINGQRHVMDPARGEEVKVIYSNRTVISDNRAGGIWEPGNIYIGVGDKCVDGVFAAGSDIGNAQSKRYAIAVALERPDEWYCLAT